MSKIFDLGRTPEEWSEKMRARGVDLSPRTLRSKAREHGQYFALGRTMLITPDQMDEILLREADRAVRPVDFQRMNRPKTA